MIYQPELDVSADFSRVVRYCQRWGVKLTFKAPCPFPAFNPGPLWGALDWQEHHIFWPLDPELRHKRFRTHVWAPALLHELAHCLASEPPKYINEPLSEMLAFEYLSTRYLRISGWKAWMYRYGIPEDRGVWHALSAAKKHDWISASLEQANTAGLLDVLGRPTFVPPWRSPGASFEN